MKSCCVALFMHIIFCKLLSKSYPVKTLCWSILSNLRAQIFNQIHQNSVCMRKLYLMLIPAIWISTGCTKSVSSEENNAAQQRADAFSANIKTHKYKPVAFYSDKPIDYITNDTEVRSETDLWIYVKDYIKDDINLFNPDGTVTIFQNAVKMPGNESASFTMRYGASVVNKEVMFDFVDYNYVVSHYKLEQFDDAYFTVYVDGPSGSKLYSKFARVE